MVGGDDQSHVPIAPLQAIVPGLFIPGLSERNYSTPSLGERMSKSSGIWGLKLNRVSRAL